MTNTNAINNEINKLYDTPLEANELHEAGNNIVELFKVLAEIDAKQVTNQKSNE